MLCKNIVAIASILSVPLVAAKTHRLAKRDGISWGPVVGLGPPQSGVEIVSVLATIYPGDMPSTQNGGLYNWIGITNTSETGDLIQGIVGSYLHGESECSGSKADELWCISSEVYGWDSETNAENQWVGDLRTLAYTPADGVTFNYTLVDKSTSLWVQTARNARTNELLASFNKTSVEEMTIINTAIECQDCTPAIDAQYWINTTIGLSAADPSFGETIYNETSASYTTPTTSDKGKTWVIANITNPVVPYSSY